MSERTKYVLRVGVLAWGVPMFILITGRELFLGQASHPQTLSHVIFGVVLGLVVWLTAGAGFGLAVWTIQERQKRKNQKSSSG